MEGVTLYDKFLVFVTANKNDQNYKNFERLVQQNKEKFQGVDVQVNIKPMANDNDTDTDNANSNIKNPFMLTLSYGCTTLLMLGQFGQPQLDELLNTIKTVREKDKKKKSQVGGSKSYEQKYHKYKSKYYELKKVITSFAPND